MTQKEKTHLSFFSGAHRRIIFGCVLFFLTKSYSFRHQSIPLGYDPGLYKSLFEHVANLSHRGNFSQLPQRIQNMYEPFLGMIFGSYHHLTGVTGDGYLTRGRIAVSFLLPLGTYLVAKQRGKAIAAIAFFLVCASFTQFTVFWRAYRKQTIGLFMLCCSLRLRRHDKRTASIPTITATLLLNRPAGVILIIAMTVKLTHSYFTKDSSFKYILISPIASILLGLPIYGHFIANQIIGLISPFFESRTQLPTLDTFQAGGTFLTTTEYLITTGFLIPIGIRALIKSRRKNGSDIATKTVFITLLIRVFGQGFFFQRMIGYLDIFLIIYTSYGIYQLLNAKTRHKIIAWIAIALTGLSLGYRGYITHKPIIEQQEFAFLKEIATKIPQGSIIIVPGIWYSPRVQGWVSNQVLAPGLFDINKRGDLSQEREPKRMTQSATGKCQFLASDYPDIINKPTYVRVGSKQYLSPMDGACFVLEAGTNTGIYQRYRLDPTRFSKS